MCSMCSGYNCSAGNIKKHYDVWKRYGFLARAWVNCLYARSKIFDGQYIKKIGTNINYSISPKAMSAWERVVDRIVGILAVDKNGPRIAEKGMLYALNVDRDYEYGYDTASNPLQSIFILAMGVTGLMRVISKKNRIAGFEISAFLGFC